MHHDREFYPCDAKINMEIKIWYTTLIEWRIKYMTLLIDAYKAFDKSQYSFMRKLLTNWVQKEYAANFVLNHENLKAFSLKSKIRQTCPLLSLLFNTVLKVLGQLDKKKKEKTSR